MDKLHIAETTTTPEILLDYEQQNFVFSGRSLPEDPTSFYGPVLNWFEWYAEKPHEVAEFHIRLSYFNTNSSKMLFTIFQMIDKINVNNAGVANKIVLYYSDEDEDLIELAEYYKELLNTDCLDMKTY